MDSKSFRSKLLSRAVVVGSLGYFVDIYDLVLFSIVRVASLSDLGLSGAELTKVGIYLLNIQMIGMLLGGLLWGVLADRYGRLSVLFASIALYSIANLLNAFVDTTSTYAILRFIAGIGLAGELGIAITLVSESLPKEIRGYSTAIVAGVGILGALFAALLADFLNWRIAYGVGGVMGLLLLVTRIKMLDSPIFAESKKVQNLEIARGAFWEFFTSWDRFKRYLCIILLGVPCWYAVGILLTFGPEITKALGLRDTLVVGTGFIFLYGGLSLGDFLSGIWSQKIKSRNTVIVYMLIFTCLCILLFLSFRNMSVAFYYTLYFLIGLGLGYWALFVTIAAEQFGTNLRATAATTAPNFVRAAVVPMTLTMQYLQGHFGLIQTVSVIGFCILIAALFAIARLKDSYSTDLNYLET